MSDTSDMSGPEAVETSLGVEISAPDEDGNRVVTCATQAQFRQALRSVVEGVLAAGERWCYEDRVLHRHTGRMTVRSSATGDGMAVCPCGAVRVAHATPTYPAAWVGGRRFRATRQRAAACVLGFAGGVAYGLGVAWALAAVGAPVERSWPGYGVLLAFVLAYIVLLKDGVERRAYDALTRRWPSDAARRRLGEVMPVIEATMPGLDETGDERMDEA